MRASALVVLLFVSALAGCLDDDVPNLDDPIVPGEGPLLGPASGLPVLPRDTYRLDAAPEWRVGEWWRIRFSAPPYGVEATFDQVVAGVDGNEYLVGMDTEEWNDGVILLHYPAFGNVNRTTLLFEAHDRPIKFLRFPLTKGATWETQWYNGAPHTAIVDDVVGDTATIHITGTRDIHVTYNATVGAITALAISGYGGYEVIDHGYGYNGTVRVPADQDLVFCHGRAQAVQAVVFCTTGANTDPKTPTERVTVAAGYDGVSFGLFLADTQSTGAIAPSVLRIEVRDPAQGTYRAMKAPDRPGYLFVPFSGGDPAGTWEITTVAAGAGLAILEGVAYKAYEVTLTGPAEQLSPK